MRKALDTFDTGLARNPRVRINEKAGGWISVTPLTAQPEPTNLAYGNQAVILRAWGRLEEAMALHKEQEALCLELGDKDGLSRSYGNQALILQDWDFGFTPGGLS